MRFVGALVKERGVTFAIVAVKPDVLNSSLKARNAILGCSRYFPRVPIILMTQDSAGRPTYQGRSDIVKFLANISPSRIPWKRYTAN